jgi:heme exporter protein B
MLFASVTAVARSFAQESTGHQLYLYTIASPLALLLAKLVYNTVLMIVLGLVGLGIFGVLVGYPVGNTALFLVVLILGCTGLSACFTMISAIAAKAGQNFTLMAILGFPLILPLLLLIIRISKYAIDDLGWNLAWSYIGMITLLNLIVVTLSCILFPYLWRD